MPVIDRSLSNCRYELFAVLIHSGSAIGGHYYCYCKDGEGSWYEFNDSTISSIAEEDVAKSYGGSVTNARGGYSWSYSSSASAYMLMYRRKDDALNIISVGKDDLPEGLSAELEATAAKEAAEKAIVDAETGRRRGLEEHTAYGDYRAADMELKKTSTLREAIAQIRVELHVPADVSHSAFLYCIYMPAIDRSFSDCRWPRMIAGCASGRLMRARQWRSRWISKL